MADRDIEQAADLAETGSFPINIDEDYPNEVVVLLPQIFSGTKLSGIACPICGGTGQVTVPDSRDSAWHPRRPITYRCDCTDRDQP
jgi:hypothetical protein